MSLILCSYTKLGTVDLMKLFKYSFRYMDTYIFWIAGTHYNSLILTLKEFHPIPFGYVLWTSSIEIKIETDRISIVFLQQGTNAHFMNIQISIINEKDGLFWTQHFDKRRNLPFQYAQFLQFWSNRSVSQSYNIIQSQAFPILYLSNNVHDVMNELELLLQVNDEWISTT